MDNNIDPGVLAQIPVGRHKRGGAVCLECRHCYRPSYYLEPYCHHPKHMERRYYGVTGRWEVHERHCIHFNEAGECRRFEPLAIEGRVVAPLLPERAGEPVDDPIGGFLFRLKRKIGGGR